ncbi:hypothetical protein B0T16DRAFT_13745 [Cercophora newfieldiana]|uniref:Uncharacterized protein n=1 Tax=Cercophora newfieldiana TaxID=92897 RepID=A0AA39YMZ7_9PEZI|nr:hypothetical protein B0T16DRAFT_13745 [Cercophora newfieldiana]
MGGWVGAPTTPRSSPSFRGHWATFRPCSLEASAPGGGRFLGYARGLSTSSFSLFHTTTPTPAAFDVFPCYVIIGFALRAVIDFSVAKMLARAAAYHRIVGGQARAGSVDVKRTTLPNGPVLWQLRRRDDGGESFGIQGEAFVLYTRRGAASTIGVPDGGRRLEKSIFYYMGHRLQYRGPAFVAFLQPAEEANLLATPPTLRKPAHTKKGPFFPPAKQPQHIQPFGFLFHIGSFKAQVSSLKQKDSQSEGRGRRRFCSRHHVTLPRRFRSSRYLSRPRITLFQSMLMSARRIAFSPY